VTFTAAVKLVKAQKPGSNVLLTWRWC